MLVSVGRIPNGKLIGAEKAGVHVDERGFIPVDEHAHQCTEYLRHWRCGGNPMLAHKATHEAKVAAEVIVRTTLYVRSNDHPSVAYTDPEVAWMGLTGNRSQDQRRGIREGVFPWAASGRALGIGREEG